MHRTTVTLDDRTFAAWKASGRALADVIAAGLRAPGPTTGAAILARLDRIEGQLAALTAPVERDRQAADLDQALAVLDDQADELARRRAERDRADAARHAAALAVHAPKDANGLAFVTYETARTVLRLTQYRARQAVINLVAHGYAIEFEHRPGQARAWMVTSEPVERDTEPAGTGTV